MQDSVESIENTLSPNDIEFPSPYTPLSMQEEAARMIPDVDKACALIVSAAYQLISSVRSPMATVIAIATQVNLFVTFVHRHALIRMNSMPYLPP